MNIGSTRQVSGEYGGRYIDSASGTVTGNWQTLKALSTVVLGAVTSNITSLPTGVTLQAGTDLQGVFTSVAVTSGTLVAYNRKY